MDAVEFLKALERRRNYKRGPNDGHCNWAFIYFDHRSHEELVAEVEQWAKEHPRQDAAERVPHPRGGGGSIGDGEE